MESSSKKRKTQSLPKKQIVMVVERSKHLLADWSPIIKNFLDLYIRSFCQNDDEYELGLVLFTSCVKFWLLHQSSWVKDAEFFIKQLSAIEFCSSDAVAAIAEGLGQALKMLSSSSVSQGNKHCILVVASDPNLVSDAEIMAHKFKETCGSLAVVGPVKFTTNLRRIYNAGNCSAAADVKNIQDSEYISMISNNFISACCLNVEHLKIPLEGGVADPSSSCGPVSGAVEHDYDPSDEWRDYVRDYPGPISTVDELKDLNFSSPDHDEQQVEDTEMSMQDNAATVVGGHISGGGGGSSSHHGPLSMAVNHDDIISDKRPYFSTGSDGFMPDTVPVPPQTMEDDLPLVNFSQPDQQQQQQQLEDNDMNLEDGGVVVSQTGASTSAGTVGYDINNIPNPVCSCTNSARRCYRWGGGWQSTCCTRTLSAHPLPNKTKGRKMRPGAFKNVLDKLQSQGYDFSQPVDLKNYWAKHGSNRHGI